MFVIDWSQIGEGHRLDVRWIYNTELNPDQLLLWLRPLFLFSAWTIKGSNKEKGQNSSATRLY